MTGSTQHHQQLIHPHQREPPPPQVKPIRFITNDGGPYAKRRRISSACHTCRRRKTRCSGERPECDTCKQGGHECKGYGSADGDLTSTSPNLDVHQSKANVNGDPGRVHHSPTRYKSEQQRRPSMQHPASNGSTNSTPSTLPQNVDTDGPLQRKDSTPGSCSLTLSIRNRMPYFRYFGPTAIMPGFKQMIVKVHEKRSTTATSSGGEIIGSSPKTVPGIGKATPAHGEAPTPSDPPVYDTSEVAPSPLIIHLCETFFTHLGCSFPFLPKERFMRDLEEKQVDGILVDAVCALAARFSDDPILTGKNRTTSGASGTSSLDIPPPERGQAFAHRAKSSIVEAFPCPSVAVVQAALLLAYDEFGANRDSGLWMYLGIAIRMAQDLGMQKLQGLRYIGVSGPTPQSLKYSRKKKNSNRYDQPRPYDIVNSPANDEAVAELKAIEKERVDTFWAVFSLDRYISSGTGRPVTLRDEDIEVAFPPLDEIDPETGWPTPWPALIRIVHLYGRVSDVLNGIKEVAHVTADVIERLATMEKNLTDIYQGLLSRLHFNAVNFQYYASIGQGTNFIMLHFWFHTLIVLLHQPTLLHTFDGEIQQLFPKSRELSISSAKTIADIISFAELINKKSALGNPFTSQPTYIAACAFLKESASHAISSRPPSRATSPSIEVKPAASGMNAQDMLSPLRKPVMDKRVDKSSVDQQLASKHSLLASAANQNYQRCYRALQQLESYWAGTKYILTVLDQKATGVVDPLLYTREEMESALEVPKPEPSFTSPGWRRKLSWGAYLGARAANGTPMQTFTGPHDPPTPILDPSQAIGWSLSGTVNSPKSASLAVLYTSSNAREVTSQPAQSLAQQPPLFHPPMAHPPQYPRQRSTSVTQILNPPQGFNTNSQVDASRIPVSDADLLLNLHSPYNTQSPQLPNGVPHLTSSAQPFADQSSNHLGSQQQQQQQQAQQQAQQQQNSFQRMQDQGTMPYGNMMIESQDVDMSVLGGDMMWLEYLPSENLNFYDPGGTGNHTGV